MLISFRQKLQTETGSTEKLCKTLLFEIAARKMLESWLLGSYLKQQPWNNRGQFYQSFDKQFFCEKIPKAQKDTDKKTVFLHFWDLHE